MCGGQGGPLSRQGQGQGSGISAGAGGSPAANPLGGTVLRGERTWPRRGPPRAPVSSPALRHAAASPGPATGRAASRHRPLRGGSLQAKGIFLWILLEASAPGRREAAEGPPGARPRTRPESWRRASPAGPGALRPGPRTAAAQRAPSSPPERPRAGRPLTHRRVWTGPALSRCHRPAPALKSEPGSLLPLPRYLLGGAGSASKLRGIWLKIQAPLRSARARAQASALAPARAPALGP